MTPAPRVVIIGAGLMGRWHAHAARQAGAKVVAISDTNAPRAEELARRLGVRTLSAERWLEQIDADVAHICTPLASHAELATGALRAGLHTVVEKPLAATLAETRRVLEIAHTAGRHIIPVHQFPFQVGIGKLRKARSYLGQLVRLDFTTFTAGGEGRNAAGRRDVVLEILPHPISLFHALGFGTLATLDWSFQILTDNDFAATAESHGVELSVRVSLRARPTRNQLEAAATGGTALADLYHGFAWINRGGATRRDKLFGPFRTGLGVASTAATNLASRVVQNEPAYPGLRALLATFYRTLDGGEPPIQEQEILDAAAFAEVASAAYSNQSGRG